MGFENLDFENQPHTRGRGRVAEQAAATFLVGEGYRILARNVVTKAGEIDILAQEGEDLCFVEVKARTSHEFGGALAAVGVRKQQRLVRAAALYLAASGGGERAVRFDVLGMEKGEENWDFTLIRNAFEATDFYLV